MSQPRARDLNEFSRFSPFEEDHKDLPGVLYAENESRRKILKTKELLEKTGQNVCISYFNIGRLSAHSHRMRHICIGLLRAFPR